MIDALTVIPIETPTLGDRSYVVHDGEVARVVGPPPPHPPRRTHPAPGAHPPGPAPGGRAVVVGCPILGE